MKIKKITLPFDTNTINTLKAGDHLELTGMLVTARDQAHQKLVKALKNNEPIPLQDPYPILYYTGPTPSRPDQIIGSCGPTTSARMDPFTPYLIEKGFKISIGKGSRGPEVIAAIKKYKGLYLIAYGGCGALYQTTVKKNKCIAYPKLLSESICELYVENFPVVVGIDANGLSL